MEDVKLKHKLPQEGTSVRDSGESLPEPSGLGCSSYSGGSKVSQYPTQELFNPRELVNAMPGAARLANTWNLAPRRANEHKITSVNSAKPATPGEKKRSGKRIRRGRRAKMRTPVQPGGSEPPLSVHAPLNTLSTPDVEAQGEYLTSAGETERLTLTTPTANRNVNNGQCSAHNECAESTQSRSSEPGMTANAPLPAQRIALVEVSSGTPEQGNQVEIGENVIMTHPVVNTKRSHHKRGTDKFGPLPIADGSAQIHQSTLPKKANKRHLDDELSPENGTKRAKMDATSKKASSTPTFADAAKTHLLIAIAVSPPTGLTIDQAQQIELSIEAKIIEAALAIPLDNEPILTPSFRGKPIASEGVLKMWCENDDSLTWLKTTVAGLQSPIPGTKLIVIRQSDIAKRLRASLWLPKSIGLELTQIHRLLVAQNPWYGVQSWQLYGATMQEKGIFLTLGIPISEVAKILERERRVAFISGSVYVKFNTADVEGDAFSDAPNLNETKASE